MDESKNKFSELSNLKKGQPFRVPNHYFDDFSARLQNKLDAESMKVPEPQNLIIRVLKPALGLAASFALILMLVYWPLKLFTPKEMVDNTNLGNEFIDYEYRTMVEGMDENSFYVLLSEPVQKVEISDDDLLNYLSASISDYDVYIGTDY
ncbi:MAG: hypothetical protein R2757_16410 [Draconibacterium sp.]